MHILRIKYMIKYNLGELRSPQPTVCRTQPGTKVDLADLVRFLWPSTLLEMLARRCLTCGGGRPGRGRSLLGLASIAFSLRLGVHSGHFVAVLGIRLPERGTPVRTLDLPDPNKSALSHYKAWQSLFP